MKQLVLKSGIFRLSNIDNVKENEFSLSRFLKRLFVKFGITFMDPCCPLTDIQPIRYDSATGNIQGYNGTTWVDIGSLSAVI